MRGKPRRERHATPGYGLIPACAGKTPASSPNTCACRAHPRVCGENAVNFPRRHSLQGSSPRVRGKRTPPRPKDPSEGLIPACAGKTPRPPCARPVGRAHPRVCGENGASQASMTAGPGSSPRVRGKRSARVQIVGEHGLIPACAGKTCSLTAMVFALRAHPRVCGENGSISARASNAMGSSPRVRGKRSGTSKFSTILGLIPACAGKTPRLQARGPPGRAHPRVCGENLEAD